MGKLYHNWQQDAQSYEEPGRLLNFVAMGEGGDAADGGGD